MEVDYNTYESGGIRVEWAALGEGYKGDYDEDDPEDVELLRFYVTLHERNFPREEWDDEPHDEDGWYTAQDSSYCTRVPATATPEQRQALLRIIHSRAGKHDMAAMSWITLDDLNTSQEN